MNRSPPRDYPRLDPRAEAYRKVRTNLAFVSEGPGPPEVDRHHERRLLRRQDFARRQPRCRECPHWAEGRPRRRGPAPTDGAEATSTRPAHLGLVDVLAGTVELSDALQFSEAGPHGRARRRTSAYEPQRATPGSETMLRTIRQLER